MSSYGGRQVLPQGDGTRPSRRYREGVSGPGVHNHQLRWLAVDAVIAGLFAWITIVSLRSEAYVDMYGPVVGWEWALALSPIAMLLVRRLAPVTALVLATALYMVASTTLGDSNAPLAIPLFSYMVAVTRPLRVSAWIVGLAALAMSTVTFYGPGEPDVLVIVLWILLFSLGWLIGAARRSTQFRAAELTETIDHLEAQQDEVAAQAIAEERIRIARELHDAVGHAVNVMVLQAGAARISQQPDRAFAALQEVETLGRNALQDLDHMLGLLEGSPERGPGKGLSDIPALVDEMRCAGAEITLQDSCDTEVERHVQAALYRITQEALTNALKHAPGARVTVSLACRGGDVRLDVVEDGSGRRPTGSASGGRGIIGMTERAKVLGGTLAAEPTEDGGFAVRARLPLSARRVAS